ncbi:MAG: sigma-54-dependent Fis family transcriptional regulator [Oligoflexia bacterium]|nr:sigma-54-dependent Fis family transcriptional regulator [Oligoflexia bacterium]
MPENVKDSDISAAPQKREQKLRFLNELSTKLQSSLEADDFYQEIVNAIQSRFNYYCVHIWHVTENNNTQLRAQAGAYMSHLKIGYTLNAGQGITGEVVRTKKSYLSNDVRKDAHYTNLSLPIVTLSQLCVPILHDGDKVIATLNIESEQQDAFDEDDIVTLEAVAAQVDVAITNRKLFNEVKSFNKKLQAAVEEKTLELRRAHERILEQQRMLQKENKALKTLVNHDNKQMEIIGKSQAVLNILSMVDKIAPTMATDLIQGESGTGKELIARRLHFKSDRENKPYVTVNCGALQESLLESELFGHEKGAFTGAVAQKMGLCETADGGSLFLDEIGEMSLGIQAKLLRFLQEGEFYRIGGKRPIKVNARVVSATNRDLEAEVKAGRFREDLFYRLNTITLRMPPLRKRKEDIPILVDSFIKNSRFGGSAQQIKRIDPRVHEALANYDWPGNIRELQNTIERLKILAENQEIKLDDLPFSIRMPKMKVESGSDFTVGMPLDDVEKNHILQTLAYNHGNKTKTAQSLGITIKTLYNKLHRYGILKPEGEEVVPGLTTTRSGVDAEAQEMMKEVT